IGLVISPFSLPIMQMGFDRYIELIYEQPELFDQLMKINEEFCVEWANAQVEAGATAICYFDPASSTTIIPRDMYLKTGFKIASRTISRIKGPTATHMASGRCLPIVNDIAQTGTAIIGTSILEDLAQMKSVCRGKLTILGNLNGIEMRRWTPKQAEKAVKEAIAKAGTGGGFILSDNHG
ncbi:MAG: methylcobamide--CoM methyltransferase MtbA, partial [Hyphomicrobiales bacterium]|nr:methylcobamide--CoM methyltransferase MtbA [Hyphomicrobiales bacterium]